MADTPIEGEQITVNLGELKAAFKPEVVLVAPALGSCVAVCVFDPVAHVGAMAHVVLPNQPAFARVTGVEDWPGKYADKAIPNLIYQLERMGAERSRLIFKMAGGSAVLSVGRSSSRLDVGQRNIQGVLTALNREGFWPSAADLGGKQGRTLYFWPTTGLIRVRNAKKDEREY